MKKIIIVAAALTFIFSSQGPLHVVTVDGAGDVAFTNPGNGEVEDGNVAFVVDVGLTYMLQAGDGSTAWGFSIPSGSTLNGLVYRIKCRTTTADLIDAYSTILTPAVSGQRTFTVAAGSLAWITLGSSSDNWGYLGNITDFNQSSLTVGTYFNGGGTAGTLEIDALELTIYYTTSSGVKKRVVSSHNYPIYKLLDNGIHTWAIP